jgi:Zn-dependent protease
VVAKARGMPCASITLFALGGISQIESEFWMAITGPLASTILGIGFLGIERLAGWPPGGEPKTPVVAVLLWLGYINLMLAIFNMIPGYPLDGGRVLRAVIWGITHDAERGTRLAAQVGQGVAFVCILLGLYRFFLGANFGGLWLAFVGWFLLDASRSSYLQVEVKAGLRGRRVIEIMERDYPTVESHLSLQDFVNDICCVVESLLHGHAKRPGHRADHSERGKGGGL